MDNRKLLPAPDAPNRPKSSLTTENEGENKKERKSEALHSSEDLRIARTVRSQQKVLGGFEDVLESELLQISLFFRIRLYFAARAAQGPDSVF
jgi:hypothetical protein